MTFYYALLLIMCVAMILLGVVALLAHRDKVRLVKEYDERQRGVRGKAFEWAFLVGLAYFVLIMFLDLFLPEGLQASVLLIATVGLALEGFTVGCYCIFHDAYIPLTKSPKSTITILYVLGAIQSLQAVTNLNNMRVDVTESGISKTDFGKVILNGNKESAIVWMPLIVAVMSFVLATMVLIRNIRDKRNKP